MKISPLNFNYVNDYANMQSNTHVCKFGVQNKLMSDVFQRNFKKTGYISFAGNQSGLTRESMQCRIFCDAQDEFLEQILSDDKLKNLKVPKRFWRNVITGIRTKEQAIYRINLLNTMLNYPEVLSDESILYQVSDIIGIVTDRLTFDLAKKVFDNNGIPKDKAEAFDGAWQLIKNANSPKRIELAQQVLEQKYEKSDTFTETISLILAEARDEKKLDNMLSFFKEIGKGCPLKAIKLQQNKGVRIITSKYFKSEENGSECLIGKTLNESGNIEVSRFERNKPNSEKQNDDAGLPDGEYLSCRCTNSNRTVYTKKPSDSNPILQIEVVYDADGQPDYALATANSKDLSGVFEVTKYCFSDYPEDMNVLRAIHEGKIEGQKLSSVTRRGNTVYYDENLDQGDCKTTRHYFETKDDEGNITETNYR